MGALNQNIHHIYSRCISNEQGKQVKSYVCIISQYEVQNNILPSYFFLLTQFFRAHIYRYIKFDQMLHFSLTVECIYFDNVWQYNTCNINKHSHPFQIHFIPTVHFYFEIINHTRKPY